MIYYTRRHKAKIPDIIAKETYQDITFEMEIWTDNEQKFLEMMKKTRDYNALSELANNLRVRVFKRKFSLYKVLIQTLAMT